MNQEEDSDFKPASIKDYGLDDSHLGPPNENGVRPVNDAGYAAMQKAQSSTPQLQPMQQQQGSQGILGNAFNSGLASGSGLTNLASSVGSSLGSAASGIGSSLGSSLGSVGSSIGSAASGIGSSVMSGLGSILAFL